MPRVILRIDEKIEPYGLLHPKRWNMFSKSNKYLKIARSRAGPLTKAS
jgi:hypothetical protein